MVFGSGIVGAGAKGIIKSVSGILFYQGGLNGTIRRPKLVVHAFWGGIIVVNFCTME